MYCWKNGKGQEEDLYLLHVSEFSEGKNVGHHHLGEWRHKPARNSYNAKVQLRELVPGQQVLLLLPTSENKLQAMWPVPHVIQKRIVM